MVCFTYIPASAQSLSTSVTLSSTVYDPVAKSQSASASSVLGQSASFWVAVNPVGFGPTPTGLVQFFDGIRLIGVAELDANGTAIFSTATLPIGSHAISATYFGDANFLPNHSVAYPFSVNARPASLTLGASPNPGAVGASVTVTGFAADAATTDSWYPATPGTFNPAKTGTHYNLQSLRAGHSAAQQIDGSVLISGGTVSGAPVNTLEIFTPWSGRFQNVSGNLRSVRSGHTSTLLPDGWTTLIAGGDSAGDAELYTYNLDGTGSSVSTGSMVAARSGHTATLLGGYVLIAGGTVNGVASNTLELFNGSFTLMTGTLAYARSGHTATLLASTGTTYTLLLAGGDATGTAEIIVVDTARSTVTQLASAVWLTARSGHTATLLPDGKTILFTGGVQQGIPASSAELYAIPSDMASFSFDTVATANPLNIARADHTATLVNDGTLVFTGGESDPTQSAEFYYPAFGPRGSISVVSDDATDTLLGSPCVLRLSGYAVNSCDTTLIPNEVGVPRNITALYTSNGTHVSNGTGTLSPALTANKGIQAAVTVSAPASAIIGQTGLYAAASGGSGTGAYSYSSATPDACSVSAASGALTFTASSGSCSIVAMRSGDVSYIDSALSVPAVILLSKASQAAVTVLAPASAMYGQTGLSAVASGGSGTGSYTYSAGSSTACSVASTTGALTITGGTGTCSITVVRAADNTYDASAISDSALVMVTPAPLIITANNQTKAYGAPLPSLTASYGGFVNGDTPSSLTTQPTLATTATVLSPVSGSPYAITASGAVDGNYTISYVPGTLTVTQGQTQTTLQTSAPSVMLQNSVTFTAKVTGAVTPGGNVNFTDGTTTLGSVTLDNTGTAALMTSALAAGSHSIIAVYTGTSDFAGSSSAATVETVEDFTLNASSSSTTVVSVMPGNAAVYVLQLAPTAGTTFTGSVTLALTGLPAGATYTVSPSSIAAGSGATTVTVTINTAKQQASVTKAKETRGFPLMFAFCLPLLGICKMRNPLLLKARTSAIVLLLLALLALMGMAACGSGSGFFSQSPQTYSMTLTGTSGALHHSIPLTLTVQ